jgi:hypothetical protein
MKVLPQSALRDASRLIPTQIKGTTRQKWVRTVALAPLTTPVQAIDLFASYLAFKGKPLSPNFLESKVNAIIEWFTVRESLEGTNFYSLPITPLDSGRC